MSLFITLSSATASAQNGTNNWPALPLLEINTEGGVAPTATVVSPPEDCFGMSIISEYVPGRLTISLNNHIVYDSGDYEKGTSGIKIKIRGNTSGVALEQHPYKLKLSKKADLLNTAKSHKSKDWALLSLFEWNRGMKNEESNILFFTGLAVCQALEFPWEPSARFVNVTLNGKYCGIYRLTETIERDDNRIATSKTGFIIENDAYWWKEGEVWFKTERQHSAMGYTFKYPDPDDLTNEQKEAITAYMNTAENAIFTNEGMADFIDIESFARWILAHDILGSSDSAGSNMYLYKNSLGVDEPSDDKLKMATLWDFDSSFLRNGAGWSLQHIHPVFYYPELFKNAEFVDKYKELYNKYKDTIYGYVENSLNELISTDGEAFEQSRLLHRQTYPNESRNTLNEQIEDILTHLRVRLDELAPMMAELQSPETSVGCIATGYAGTVKRTDLYGRNVTATAWHNLPTGIYIEQHTDGTTTKRIKNR